MESATDGNDKKDDPIDESGDDNKHRSSSSSSLADPPVARSGSSASHAMYPPGLIPPPPRPLPPSYSFVYGLSYALGPSAVASVLFWVGVWGLNDAFLFPGRDDDVRSALASLALAVPLTASVHFLHRRRRGFGRTQQRGLRDGDRRRRPHRRHRHQRRHGDPNDKDGPRSLFLDVFSDGDEVVGPLYVTLAGLAGVEYWRGVWLLWNSCVFPERPPALQSSLAVLVSVVVLLATRHYSTSVLGRPVMFPEVHNGLSSLGTSFTVAAAATEQEEETEHLSMGYTASDHSGDEADDYDDSGTVELVAKARMS